MKTCETCLKQKPDAKRYTRSCKACYMKAWRKANPNANRAIEGRRKLTPAQRAAAWRAQNPVRHKELKAADYARNKPRYLARNQKRRAADKRATPAWLTDEQKHQITSFYETRPKGYHVDHIVPLRGVNVCGLNVPWNLQHLPAQENLKKNNR